MVDSTGTAVDITIGVTTDRHGRFSRAMGIGDGPTALLTDDAIARLKTNLDDSERDLARVEGRR
ncbi:hypothetical protein ACFORH_42910 [Amycolatopsis roodepoortensis]|uniref:Uncharacterized protein n=1 Tax=Amycolatopsis roodepoortensis TaxID=700274 RepID=A0ABR9L3E4_9PSEU|nr:MULTISPECIES: hypothetical protein [Amycolatopsis]MBE1575077.1 hypothetical protein [Amycolatopsis roodepoortensis]GHG97507.1 hypothetical protein GCM10017788_77050 [Amycolatopsis acidiphila]